MAPPLPAMTSRAGAPSGMDLMSLPVVPFSSSSAPVLDVPSARPMTPLSDSDTDVAALLTETLPIPLPSARLMSNSPLLAASPASAQNVPFGWGWPAASRFFGAAKMCCGLTVAGWPGCPLVLPPDEQAASAAAVSAPMTMPTAPDRIPVPCTGFSSRLVVASLLTLAKGA